MSRLRRILLVEDDLEQARLFTQVLSLSGYEVVTVRDSEAALDQIRVNPFDLALVDWDLPGIKGDAFILLLKVDYPNVKTVLYSNHYSVDQAAEACGADAWFRKIEGISALRQVVSSLLPQETGQA